MRIIYIVIAILLVAGLIFILMPGGVLQKEGSSAEIAENNKTLEAGNPEVQDLIETPQPATKIYKSAEEAFNAVKEASKKYDLEVLERFSLLDDCGWCRDFYGLVRKELQGEGLNEEEKAYFCELLTSSGNPEDIEFLVEMYKSAKSDSEKEVILRSLEVAVANEKVLDKIYEKIKEEGIDPKLRESLVAALTVQGQAKAVQYLYELAESQENPSQDAEKGLGLAYTTPPDEALGFLEEKLKNGEERLDYLVSAAILNNGLEGVKIFVDLLQNQLAERLSKHFEELIDHVPVDEEIRSYLNYVKDKGTDTQKVFANKVLSAFEIIQRELESEGVLEEEDEGMEKEAQENQ